MGRPEIVSRREPAEEPLKDTRLVPVNHQGVALFGQPIESASDVAAAQGLTSAVLSPVVTLADGHYQTAVSPEVAEAYVKSELQRVIRFELDEVGNLLEANRQERICWISYTTKRRRRVYRAVLPVAEIAQPVADALAESWLGLREKAKQDGRTRKNYDQANRHFEAAVNMLHEARQHLSDPELAFAVGAISPEIVFM